MRFYGPFTGIFLSHKSSNASFHSNHSTLYYFSCRPPNYYYFALSTLNTWTYINFTYYIIIHLNDMLCSIKFVITIHFLQNYIRLLSFTILLIPNPFPSIATEPLYFSSLLFTSTKLSLTNPTSSANIIHHSTLALYLENLSLSHLLSKITSRDSSWNLVHTKSCNTIFRLPIDNLY